MQTNPNAGLWTGIRRFGRQVDDFRVPNLTELQTKYYAEFLQRDVPPEKRAMVGIHSIVTETFPIQSYEGKFTLEYVRYTLGKPRYTPDECRNLKLTYGAPFRLQLRLLSESNEPIEEEVYLGEIPLMIGGGEFIVNGAERVIVTQLHRSPGVDFSVEVTTGEKKLHNCWVIPERGSWIELQVTKKDTLSVRIDQSSKFSAMTLLRAMWEEDRYNNEIAKYSTNEDIVRRFHKTKLVQLGDVEVPDRLNVEKILAEFLDALKGVSMKLPDRVGLGDRPAALPAVVVPERVVPPSFDPVPVKEVKFTRGAAFTGGKAPTVTVSIDREEMDTSELAEALEGWRLAEDLESIGLEAGHRLTEDDVHAIWEDESITDVTRHDRVNINLADLDELVWTHDRAQTGLTEKRAEKLLEKRGDVGFFHSLGEASNGIGVTEANAAKWKHVFFVGAPGKAPQGKASEELIKQLRGWRLAEEVDLASGRRLLKGHRLTEADIDRIYDSPHINAVKIFTRVNLNDTDDDELAWTDAEFKTGLTAKRIEKVLTRSMSAPFKSLDEAQKGIGLSAAQSRAWDLVFVCGPVGRGEQSAAAPPSFVQKLVGFELAQPVQLKSGKLIDEGTVLTDADATDIYAQSTVEQVYLWQRNLNEITFAEFEHVNAAYDLHFAPEQLKKVKAALDKHRPFKNWDEFAAATELKRNVIDAKVKPYFFGGPNETGNEAELLDEVLDKLVGRRLARDVMGVGGKKLLPRFLKLTASDVESLFKSTSVPAIDVLKPEDQDYFIDRREPGTTQPGEPNVEAILDRLLKPKEVKLAGEVQRRDMVGKFTFAAVQTGAPRPLVERFQAITANAADELIELVGAKAAEETETGGKKKKTKEVALKAPAYVAVCTHTKREWIVPGIKKGSVDPKEQAKLVEQIVNRRTVSPIIDPTTGEVIIDAFLPIQQAKAEQIISSGIPEIEVIENLDDELILESLKDDSSTSHEDALMRIYARLRPGQPPNLDKAKQLFREKFMVETRYKLGRVGRFRLNRKFGSDIDEDVQTLQQEDLANAIEYILKLRKSAAEAEGAETDDIDHLGNRRVKTIDELAGDELRKGFLKLKKHVQDRMQMESTETPSPKTLVNSKTISSAISFFFGRSELSQVVDQTNPLSQLTHERRLSALGPGGLNRKRAGFEVRDVHISHYGRICPIETPEGTNIGLISSLAVYAGLDQYGFLTTPYRVVRNNVVTSEIQFLRADQEMDVIIAPADILLDAQGRIVRDTVMARIRDEFMLVPAEVIQYIDISPKQLVGVSASLIPFLEHDDANRALMGSNMQRQAVPLLITDPPRVATGMEKHVAANSGMVIVASRPGVVTYADAARIDVTKFVSDKQADKLGWDPTKADVQYKDSYELRKFVGLNERTCLNQKPIVTVGQAVEAGQVIADGAATRRGELALGKNVLVAFMPWDGYNFEDAILVSEELVQQDVYTSIHIDEFEVEIRETKLGREEFTREIPHVSEKARRNLDDKGIVRVGTRVSPGDILVGKVAPKSKSELTPEEKLLYAIFGKAGEDVKNDSLEVPSGVEGIVIHTQHFSKKPPVAEEDRKTRRTEEKQVNDDFTEQMGRILKKAADDLSELAEGKDLKFTTGKDAGKKVEVQKAKSESALKDIAIRLRLDNLNIAPKNRDKAIDAMAKMAAELEDADEQRFRQVTKLTRGDELQTGVLEMVKVFVATKRTLSVGDKFAGRHGNKGVVSRILPVEDMPFIEDGTSIQMILNPLGVPSRMNIGQILETHLGWAAFQLGIQCVTPIFDGATEEEIEGCLREAGLSPTGKVQLYDGRTGDPFDQKTTVGFMYMLKLHHLVDDKVHARATGPYSLITQQPLGGKARFGGQRFGEMEVWALEAYGAAHTLQELLTVKSDDVDGRTKIYESMVKGNNLLEPGTPVSFDVLTHEIKGLALNIELNKKSIFDTGTAETPKAD